MTKKLDPYKELEVPTTATEKQVRKAYRRKAAKVHPDAGGNREDWDRLSRALVVLTNPQKRAHFDRTGNIDDSAVDNDLVQARQMVLQRVIGYVANFVNAGFNPALDPRRMKVLAMVGSEIEAEFQKAKQQVQVGRNHIDVMRDYAKRFTRKSSEGDDVVMRALEHQIDSMEDQIRAIETAMRAHALAKEMLKEYEFRSDPPIVPTYFTASNSTSTWG